MSAKFVGRHAPRVRARAVALLRWLAALALVTALMLPFRGRLDKAHVAFMLLLVVLGASAAGGRSVGLGLAGASFLVFNWFFLPPYHTLVIADPLDWLVLVAFLATSVVAAQLLYAAQEEARVARERTAELDRLRVVGAEALNAGRAEDALGTVAAVIREAAGVDWCAILAPGPAGALEVAAASGAPAGGTSEASADLARWASANNAPAAELGDGTVRLHAAQPSRAQLRPGASDAVRALLLPLSVRERVVGVLRLEASGGVTMTAERWRFVEALSYYAALGVERVRLVAAAEHAEALREADRLKDALLASVSHDLRTPLTTIKARAHELRRYGDEGAEVIEQEADRLNRMVADLLDLSCLNAGALPVHPELNAVDELIELVTQRVEGALGDRPLRVRLPSDGDLLFGRFDLALAVRVIVNLVENADKYAPTGTPVEVAAARAGDWLDVAVADRGPGLAPGEQERAFEPFRRAPGAPPDVSGAGLGLAIARRLAEAQGGRLSYAPRDGGGSVFTLSLPAADPTDERGAVRGS